MKNNIPTGYHCANIKIEIPGAIILNPKISNTEFRLICFIADRTQTSGCIPIYAVASALKISQRRVCRLLNKLQRQGFIEYNKRPVNNLEATVVNTWSK